MKGSYCRGKGAFNTGSELRSKQRYVLPKTDDVNGPLHTEYCLGLTNPTHFSKKKTHRPTLASFRCRYLLVKSIGRTVVACTANFVLSLEDKRM